jgi:hypothetical protein
MGVFLRLAVFSLKPLINLEQRPEKACKIVACHVIQRSNLICAGWFGVGFQGSGDALGRRFHTFTMKAKAGT